MEEAIRLAEDLGLMSANEGAPDPDELVMRLRGIRPEWDWKEDIDPDEPPSAGPLSQINQQGIFNRAVHSYGPTVPVHTRPRIGTHRVAENSGDERCRHVSWAVDKWARYARCAAAGRAVGAATIELRAATRRPARG